MLRRTEPFHCLKIAVSSLVLSHLSQEDISRPYFTGALVLCNHNSASYHTQTMQSLSENPRGLTLVIVATIFTFLCFVTTSLRLLVRRLEHLLGWDDWTALASLLLLIVQWIVVSVAVHYGLGAPKGILSAQDVEFVLKYMWLLQFWCFLTVALPKISICIFILRIKNYGWLRW